jgi:uncharacterized protein (UPF0276 family)
MGSSISGIRAILFMDKLDRMTFSQHLLIDPYKRYVDDMYLQIEDENQADNFYRNMNQLHPRIKFEIENQSKLPKARRYRCSTFRLQSLTREMHHSNFTKIRSRNPLLPTISPRYPTKLNLL